MESPTFDSFDVAPVKIDASEECSNNANTDFGNLCWLKKDNNQDQVDDVLAAPEKNFFNPFSDEHEDLDNYPNKYQPVVEDHLNLNNQNNLSSCIKSELNGAADENNDHETSENNHHDVILHETENKNNLVCFDDFGPETSVDELVPGEKINDHEEEIPMETTVSSSPSIEVTTNTFDELNFQEKAEEVIITPSSDLDDDSVDKQLSSVDNTNTLSEVDEEPEKMVFEEDIVKSPVEEDILKSPESEPVIDENIIVEEKSFSHENGKEEKQEEEEKATVAVTDEQHFESTMDDSKANANIFGESIPAAQNTNTVIQDSCDESDEEWNYMKAKEEGQTEKENNDLSEEFKDEPVTEKEISSVELKEQLDTTPPPESVTENNLCDPVVEETVSVPVPATPEPEPQQQVSQVADDQYQTTPEMMTEENNFHLNPEAKEFVPNAYTSPTATPQSTEQQNGDLDTLQIKQPYGHVFDDVVSQSPRKGRESNMDDFMLPAENDFDDEIANRPHELLDDDVKMPEAGEPVVIDELQNENELLIQNALDNVGMKDSLYVENTSSGFNNGEVDLLNTIQQLPEVEIEENNVLSNKEGLSLEIDEKDVISPSSEDIKEIVTEIEEMKIHEKSADVSQLENVSQPEVNVSQLVDPEVEIPQAEEIKLAEEIQAEPVEEVKPEPVEEVKPEPVEEIKPEPVQEIRQEPVEEIKPEPVEELKPEPIVEKQEIIPVEETVNAVTNGDINVEELNKKNLEESAKLDVPVKIEDSKLLEATLGVVAVTAAATATIKAASATSAKKSPISKTPTTAAKKPTTTTAAKKPLTTTTTAARPKTAPVKSTTERKPTTTTSRTTVTATKPRVDIKKTTTTTTTLSKPKEVTKTTEIKKTTTTTTSARPTVPRTASATTARPRPATASSLTNGVSKPATARTTTSSSTLKPTTTTGAAAAPKPRLSPRSTVSSTLRKAETLKSPSASKTAPTSRIDSGLKSATKPAIGTTKTSTLRGTSTTSNRLTAKTTTTTTTTTSQRKTASPLVDKKKTLAPTSARKSTPLTKTPAKSPGAKPAAAKALVTEPEAPVAAAPAAVDIIPTV